MAEQKPTLNMDSVWETGAVGAIRALAFLCDIITYPVYLFVQRPWEKRAKSRRIKAKPIAVEEKSITYRSIATAGAIHQTLIRENVDTLTKMLQFTIARFGSRKALGTRKILAEEDEPQPNGRVFKKYVMGDYQWMTYNELDLKAAAFGSGLRVLGCQPRMPVVIFAETRAEWMIAAHGCFKQNIPVVTIYATLGEEAIAHGINETEVTAVITTHDLLQKFHKILKLTPKVKTLIYMEDQLVKTDTNGFDGIEVISFSEVLTKGSQTVVKRFSGMYSRESVKWFGNNFVVSAAVPPTSDDIAIIMYTSGSTGVPKGVLLSHGNMMATLKAFSDCIEVQDGDTFMGYLPLAHVFELLTESACLVFGIPIGYSTPLTMIDSSSKIKRGTKGDASVLKPTIMTAVPLILDRIYKGIQEKVASGGSVKKILFNFAYTYKLWWTRRGFDTPLINKVIFGATRALLGGRIRLILSGGAPLSPDTHQLAKTCLCVKVIQGYGLTESASSCTAMDLDDMSTGRVGAPVIGCDVRLVDWAEGNYTVKDKPFPRGELIIGGANISQGYYKLAEKSKEDFFVEDGRQWFRTGDIAEVHPDGSFKIIDRKKDLVKLQAGEYVSLGKVESELKTCPVVENICVYGDSSKHFCVALVVPNPSQLAALTSAGPDVDFEELCKSPEAEKAVLKELETYAKRGKLEKFEVPQAVKLCSEVWSPDMGLVTAAFKLKRKDIQARYQHEINRMYAS